MTGSQRPHVVALSGSLRAESYTRIAAQHVLDAADAADATTDLVDLRALDLAIFDADERDAGDTQELRQRVRAADAVILATPTYHGSYSSPLKTALDYCGGQESSVLGMLKSLLFEHFEEFEDKTVGLLAVSGGSNSYPSVLNHLRIVAQALHAWVLPHQVGIGAPYEVFDEMGAFRDEYADLESRVTTLGREAVEYAGIIPGEVATKPMKVSAND
jgi:NAD(P)H-dependent FMN reductase